MMPFIRDSVHGKECPDVPTICIIRWTNHEHSQGIGLSHVLLHHRHTFHQENNYRGDLIRLRTSDVIGSGGRTKSGVVWELSVKALDANRCELSNHVIGKTTPEYWEHLGKSGVPFEVAKQAQDISSAAHNAQETPLFAKSMEAKALKKRAASK